MKQTTRANFAQEVFQSELPVLADFYADWCAPCRMLGPTIHQLAEEREGALKVVQVNVSQDPELAAAFGVESIPTLIYFQGGKVKGKSVGLIQKDALEEKLRAWEGH